MVLISECPVEKKETYAANERRRARQDQYAFVAVIVVVKRVPVKNS